MDQQSTYSLVVFLPQRETDAVADVKSDVCKRVGWFNSRNSDAHITVWEGSANEDKLKLIVAKISEFTNFLSPVQIAFSSSQIGDNGAFFLIPEQFDKKKLVEMFKDIYKILPVKRKSGSFSPHISIARGLEASQIAVIRERFSGFFLPLSFLCHEVCLRKFDEISGQFVIINRFSFEAKEDSQLKLF